MLKPMGSQRFGHNLSAEQQRQHCRLLLGPGPLGNSEQSPELWLSLPSHPPPWARHDCSHWLGNGDGAQQEMQDELWMVFQQQWRVGKCPRQEFFSFLKAGLNGSCLGSLQPWPQPSGLRMPCRGQAAPPAPPSSLRSASCSPEMNGGRCSGY